MNRLQIIYGKQLEKLINDGIVKEDFLKSFPEAIFLEKENLEENKKYVLYRTFIKEEGSNMTIPQSIFKPKRIKNFSIYYYEEINTFLRRIEKEELIIVVNKDLENKKTSSEVKIRCLNEFIINSSINKEAEVIVYSIHNSNKLKLSQSELIKNIENIKDNQTLFKKLKKLKNINF